MGFKCPNCNKDFGNNKSKLDEHLMLSTECGNYAQYFLMSAEFLANKDVPKKQRKLKHTTRKFYKALDINKNNTKRKYKFIGTHDWEKVNIVSNKDGSDTIKCKKCGLQAKRIIERIIFYKHTSANKIENCKPLK